MRNGCLDCFHRASTDACRMRLNAPTLNHPDVLATPQKRTVTYRSLLALLDQDPLCAARSQAAMRLARALDCHLVGVAPTGLIDLPASAHAAASLAEYAGLAWGTLRDQAERATDRFRDRCPCPGCALRAAFKCSRR